MMMNRKSAGSDGKEEEWKYSQGTYAAVQPSYIYIMCVDFLLKQSANMKHYKQSHAGTNTFN